MLGIVAYIGPSAGYLALANPTTRQYSEIILEPPPAASFAGSSVEWIMECPTGVKVVYATAQGGTGGAGGPMGYGLPKFTPVQFTDAFGTRSSVGVFGDPYSGQTVNIFDESDDGSPTSVAVGHGTVTITYDPRSSLP